MTRPRTLGLAATVAAVLVLAGSLVLGLRRGEKPTAAIEAPRPVARPGTRVRVEVLNAGGVPGVAREATRILRGRGYDVVYFGNARGFAPDSSLVLDRVGREEVARGVAEALAIPRVATRPDSSLYLEVSVVLGKDWKPRTP